MEIIILCETKRKESYQEGIQFFFKQYAVAHNLNEKERQEYHDKYPALREDLYASQNPTITMRRRVDVIIDAMEIPREWEVFDCWDGITLAANRFGDSDYYKAESKCSLHSEAVKQQNRFEQLHREHDELLKEKNNLRDKYQRMYDAELKEKRLFSKAKTGSAPQDVIDEMQTRLKAQRNAEVSRIDDRMNQIVEELKTL